MALTFSTVLSNPSIAPVQIGCVSPRRHAQQKYPQKKCAMAAIFLCELKIANNPPRVTG
jgi:hypothetical protein